MNAVEYLKEKGRMTNNCKMACDECPFSEGNNGQDVYCDDFECSYTEQAVEIVEKWSKEHPVKTYLSVLLEKMPKAMLDANNTPYLCIKNYFGEETDEECFKFEQCVDCWNREYKEEI